MFLLCWAPAPFFVSFVWVFLFVALCFWVCVGRYAFLTGGNAFLPNAWICVWFVLFCHHPVYRLFVSSYDLVTTTFISHTKDRAFELNRPHSRKKKATCQSWIEHVENASIARVSGRLHPLDSTGNQREIFCAFKCLLPAAIIRSSFDGEP